MYEWRKADYGYSIVQLYKYKNKMMIVYRHNTNNIIILAPGLYISRQMNRN